MFSALIAGGIVFFVSYKFIATRTKPMTNKRKKQALSAFNEFKAFERKQKIDKYKEVVYKYFDKIAKIQLSDYKRDKLNYLITRLNIEDLTPERILGQQILAGLFFVFLSFLMLCFTTIEPGNYILAGVVAACGVFAVMSPVRELQQKIDTKDKHIMDDLFSFYSIMCSTYQKSFDTPPEEIVNTFIRTANPDMAEELSILLINIQSVGAIKAFMILKKRVPLPYMMRVCDTLITRFSTMTDNTSTMLYLKEELKKLRYDKLREKLKKKKQKVEISHLALIIIVTILGILHLYFQSFSSIKVLFT